MAERLQKIIAAHGLLSRRAAEQCIQKGGVTVDGVTARLGQRADPETQRICVNGKSLPRLPAKQYLVLHKPRGVVTTCHDPQGRPTVLQCLPSEMARLVPAGRLDRSSEGLLLLSNDGGFINALTHPSHELEKEYHVSVSGDVDKALPILCAPMSLDGRPLAPVRVLLLGETRLSFILREGINRQVRRMCEQAGLTVKRLVRVRIGSLRLTGLPMGQWRHLTPAEIAAFRGKGGRP